MGAVQDPVEAWDSLEKVYVAAADQGSLPMRLMAMVPLPTWSALNPHALKHVAHSRVVEMRGERGGGQGPVCIECMSLVNMHECGEHARVW